MIKTSKPKKRIIMDSYTPGFLTALAKTKISPQRLRRIKKYQVRCRKKQRRELKKEIAFIANQEIYISAEVLKRVRGTTIELVDEVAEAMDHHPIDDLESLFLTREQEAERRYEDGDEDTYPLDYCSRVVLKEPTEEPAHFKGIGYIWDWEFDLVYPATNFEEYFEIDFNHVPEHKVDSYGDFAFYGDDKYLKETKEYPKTIISEEEKYEIEIDYQLHNVEKLKTHLNYIVKRQGIYSYKVPELLETGYRSEYLLQDYYYYDTVLNLIVPKEIDKELPIYQYLPIKPAEKLKVRLASINNYGYKVTENLKQRETNNVYAFEKDALQGKFVDYFMELVTIIVLWYSAPYWFSQLPFKVRYFIIYHYEETIETIQMIYELRNLEWGFVKALWDSNWSCTGIPYYPYLWDLSHRFFTNETWETSKVLVSLIGEIF
ncbi:hypothetical protein RB653_011179 (mitochondrion) [Dictyostelium firmibasis]|uniref:Uncharacterized protein n=1 Tax=Dictyostelium firmibasis TaxID=79012 RepID=A0AAN7TSS2_9MYCE